MLTINKLFKTFLFLTIAMTLAIPINVLADSSPPPEEEVLPSVEEVAPVVEEVVEEKVAIAYFTSTEQVFKAHLTGYPLFYTGAVFFEGEMSRGDTMRVIVRELPPGDQSIWRKWSVAVYDPSGHEIDDAPLNLALYDLSFTTELDGFYRVKVWNSGYPFDVEVRLQPPVWNYAGNNGHGSYISNQPPIASIDSISPSLAKKGEEVTFSGSGTDPDGSVVGYNWRSSIDGQLSTSSSFSASNLSEGTHTIYFKVRDNDGLWSPEARGTVTIVPNRTPTAYIDSISPNQAKKGESSQKRGSDFL